MAPAGLGVDLVEVARVRRLLARHPGFAARCFTAAERAYALARPRPEEHLAVRFAGKEAVMKSLGLGWRQAGWREVEITGGGAPRVVLRGRAERRAAALGVGEVKVGLSHAGGVALAVALAVREG